MKKLKIGVIGAGIYGEYHIKTFLAHPNVSEVVVCDRNKETLDTIKKKYSIKGYAEVSEMVQNETLDAVSIATPDPFHFEPLKDSIQGGIKNILCEKPLATDEKELEEIMSLAKEHDTNIYLDFHKRWDPAYNNIKDTIENKNDKIVRGYMALDDVIAVPETWFTWTEQSSPSWFLGVHCYDLIRYLTGSEVTSVYAVSNEGVLKSKGIDTLDNLSAILTMEDGSNWTVENNWILPNSFPKSNDGQLVIVTEKQYFKNESYRGTRTFTDEKPEIPNYIFMNFDGDIPSGFGLDPMLDFVETIIHGKDYKADLMDGYQASKIALAVHESARTGKVVKL